jgi:WD40 repeat protein
MENTWQPLDNKTRFKFLFVNLYFPLDSNQDIRLTVSMLSSGLFSISNLLFSFDSNFLSSTGQDGFIHIYNLET